MKKVNKIMLIIFSVIVCLLLVFCALDFWYYPHYKSTISQIEIDTSKYNEGEIKVMSCNVRTISPDDMLKRSWFYRANLIINNIKEAEPSIIGFQEVTSEQYKYLTSTLTQYDSVIEFRDKTPTKEATPLFYKRDMYDLKDKGSFWLSETPNEMSKDWGSACYRICSYVVLVDKQTNKEFVVFNTHLDHISDEARIKGIGIVKEKIAEFGSLPSIIMGDFNAEEDSETYQSITNDFLDVKYQLDNPVKSCTYENWGKDLESNCIDYIMISQNGFKVNSYEVVTKTYNGVYPSDHFQLLASVTLS